MEERGHLSISRAGILEDEEVQVEAEHVDDHRNDNQANNTDYQMCSKLNDWHLLVAELVPQIVCGVEADECCDEQTDPFDRADAANADAGQEQPDEPLNGPALVSQSMKSGPAKSGCECEAEEHGIEEDESGDGGIGVLAEDGKGAEPDSWSAEAQISGDPVGKGDNDGAEKGVEDSHEGVIDLGRVGVARLEFEGTIVPSKVS